MSKKTAILNSALAVAVAGLGGGGYVLFRSDGSGSNVTRVASTVQRGSVQSSVTATGNLTSVTQADLSFDSAVSKELVTAINVKVGDQVKQGQVLAKLDDRAEQLALLTTQLQLTTAQTNYDNAKNGLTADAKAQLDAQEAQSLASVNSAAASLQNAKDTAAQNVVGYDENIRQAQLALTNAQLQADRDIATAQSAVDTATNNYNPAKANRDAAKITRDNAQADASYCTADPSALVGPNGNSCATVSAVLTSAQASLNAAESALTPLANALTNATNSFESQKLKSKQAVDQANNSLANSTNAKAAGLLKDAQSIDNAARQLDSARASYNTLLTTNATKRKTPTEADYAQQSLALINAQNAYATAQKNVANTQLLAPNDGTISVVNGKVGSAGSATSTSSGTGAGASSSPFMTLTDLSAFQVKVGFSETDATKIKANQTATVSVDAVGAKLNATVSSVDSSSTLVSNVVTYYAYLTIPTVPATVTIQPGMTASVSVAVQKVDNTLYLPTSAVISRGTTATVQVAKNKNDLKTTEAREITIGLRGDTTLQISSGLNEGDVVVTTRTAVSTAASGQSNTGGTLTGGTTQTGVAGVGGGGFTPGAATGGVGGNGGFGGNRAGGAGAAS
ncbi:MAG: biotin/lipoyl-binding protein [Acidimicrobiia bacterium]